MKILVVTASAFSEQRDEILNVGMDDFVRKPYRANEIYEPLSKYSGIRYIYQGHSEPEKPVMPLTQDDQQLQKLLAYLAENYDYRAILKALEEN